MELRGGRPASALEAFIADAVQPEEQAVSMFVRAASLARSPGSLGKPPEVVRLPLALPTHVGNCTVPSTPRYFCHTCLLRSCWAQL